MALRTLLTFVCPSPFAANGRCARQGPLAVGAQLHSCLDMGEVGRKRADQAMFLQLFLHRAVRQKCHSVAL